ncbi:MAG: gas vesicle accessory protein GvpU [Pseudomonadota bacterium]
MESGAVDKVTLAELALHNANIIEPLSDWMLRYLVDLANLRGLQMGITLHIDGMLVSGILVGGQTYFDGITHDIHSALGSNEDTKAIADLFVRMNNVVQAGAGETASAPPPAYIHLKEAYFFQSADSAPIPAGSGVWWRGKISQVSGFFLGNLSV